MEGNTVKGIGIGCLFSFVVFIALVSLFVFMCASLINGCTRSSSLDDSTIEAAEIDLVSHPEEPGRFDKIWVDGSEDRLAPKILRIKISGPIMESYESHSIFSSEEVSSASAALKRIRAATYDDSILGLLLEIDSPGGGVTMSDEIHDALMEFKRADTNGFVVVYMGDMCYSGGYYIASAADRIYAHPTTLTGSIGVIMNGINAAELAKKIGISDVTIASGANKDLLNPLKEVKPEHIALLRKPIEEMYERFVGLVAKGRGMPVEKVRALADGRIFSAKDALENGLVDGVFHREGLYRELKRLAGGEDVRIVRYMSRREGISRFLDTSFLFEQARGFVRGAMREAENSATPRAEYRMR